MSANAERRDQPTVQLNERILDWEGCLNARDTGGLTTIDGRRIRSGALARSDVLTRITERGQRALKEHGIRTILDIRTPAEVAHDWGVYPFGHADDDEQDGISYRNVSFTAGHDEHAWDMVKSQYAAALTREQLNRLDIDNHAAGMAGIAAAVADARPGGVLIHCHAGKDRTGLSVALLLSAVGVEDEQVAADYALSLVNLEGLISDWLDEMSDDAAERARLRGLSEPRAEAMLDTLDYVRDGYGSVAEYLGHGGLSDAQLEHLVFRLVEGSS